MAGNSRCARFTVFCAATAAWSFAQAPALKQFDVASIRSSQTPQGRGLPSLREDINTMPGTLTMRNVTLATSIRWAYHLNPYQIPGPDSISADRFDIIAKAAGPHPKANFG